MEDHENDCYAIDFGTSNSLLSHVSKQQPIQSIPMERDGGLILKSLLFTPEKNQWYFGEEAIEQYSETGGDGRFFKSIKKFLPEAGFKGTEIFGRKHSIEELVATFLREMKGRADQKLEKDVTRLVLGRPAKYSLKEEEDRLAEERMRKGAEMAGFKDIRFCPEPLAAGLDFQSEGKEEKIVLIADFGGGTSDFTLLKFGGESYSADNVLGLSGIFLAGDALDGQTMRHFISPHFGKDVTYQVPGGSNILRFPRRLLGRLCSPAHIAFLKERQTWEFLKDIQKWSVSDKEKKVLDQLFVLVEEQLGYPVYAQIEKSKIELSSDSQSLFNFRHPGIQIESEISRDQFEASVEQIVDEIIETMLEVFKQADLPPSCIDHLCLTGGTGQFPMLRKRLEEIFGAEKLSEYRVFQSVVGGLAKYAKEEMGA